ncbi:MAG: FAD-dependent thymidylate synthase [Salinibacterium sp.]|nr:MAG: FAD-dependent thymidylate synthase [Salinibacterium sp.]
MKTVRLEPVAETIYRPVPSRIDIAPHGFVQYLDHMGSDETIVEAARTSTGKGFISWEPYERCEGCGAVRDAGDARTGGSQFCDHQWKPYPRGDHGILEYMYKNRHETPAEMPVIRTLWKAPIFVFRQLHRHRAASYNEASARYMQLPNDFYAPKLEEVLGQSKTNKQGSEGALHPHAAGNFLVSLEDEQKSAYREYEQALKDGIAPETARMVLPNTIYSVCMIQMNLRMDLHMLGLRDDSHAQGITQEYARAQAAFTQALFPRWYALYEEYTKYAVRLSRSETMLLRGILSNCAGPTDSSPQWSDEAKALMKRLTR